MQCTALRRRRGAHRSSDSSSPAEAHSRAFDISARSWAISSGDFGTSGSAGPPPPPPPPACIRSRGAARRRGRCTGARATLLGLPPAAAPRWDNSSSEAATATASRARHTGSRSLSARGAAAAGIGGGGCGCTTGRQASGACSRRVRPHHRQHGALLGLSAAALSSAVGISMGICMPSPWASCTCTHRSRSCMLATRVRQYAGHSGCQPCHTYRLALGVAIGQRMPHMPH